MISKDVNEWYIKYHHNDDMLILDRITPYYLVILEKLPHIEQELIYYLGLSENKLTVKFLTNKINIDSKVVSSYLNNMCNKGLIKKEKLTKNNLYFIEDEIFKKWSKIRWRKNEK